jgi:hypothetical protein
MLTQEQITAKLDELYPSRNANTFKEGRASAIAIVETLMAQGFMECLRFIAEESNKKNTTNGK